MSWLDYLSSTLVASVGVILVVGVFALRSESAARATSLFGAQVVQRSFTEQLQIDLDNLGVGRPPGAPVVEAWTADRFAFYTVVDTSGTGGLVAYDLLPGDDGLSAVRRTVDGAERGGAVGVVRFAVELRDAAGRPVTTPADAREVEVDLRRRAGLRPRTSPRADPLDAETVGWSTTVRPFALRHPY